MEDTLTKLVLNIDKSAWQPVKFGEVAFEPKETCKDIIGEGIEHVVGLEHIITGDIRLRNSATIEESTTFSKKFQAGDVLFGRRRAYLKKAAQACFGGICSGDITVFRAKGNLLPELLPFIVSNDKFFDYAIKHSAGGLSPRVKFKDLANYEFLLPPKEQQAQLAELLWAMDEVIEGYWQTKKALEILKRKISYDCYYSEDVKKVNLEYLCLKIQDGSHFSPKTIYRDNDGSRFRYVTSKNIRRNGLEFKEDEYIDKEFHESIYRRCDTIKGDILLTKDGANTGVATLNSLDEEISLLSSVCLIRADVRKTSNEYLCQYINSDIGNVNLVNQMTGTAITRLTLTTLNKIKVPVPSIRIQNEIVSKLSKIDSSVMEAIKSIGRSKTFQKSLINQIF